MRKRVKTRKAKTSYEIPSPDSISSMILLGKIGNILMDFNSMDYWIENNTSNGRHDNIVFVNNPTLEELLDKII